MPSPLLNRQRRRKPAPWVSDDQPHPGRRMTEEEFVTWVGEKTRAEWVNGEVIVMPPASDDHDDFGWWLRTIVHEFVDAHQLGRVKGPEFTARFGPTVQRRLPDVMFVAKQREHLITRNHLEGPPDLVMELVSPDSVSRDWREKYLEYEKAGVREYWVIDRAAGRVQAYRRNRAGRFVRVPESADGKIASSLLKGFYLRTEWVLGTSLPNRFAVLRELGVKV